MSWAPRSEWSRGVWVVLFVSVCVIAPLALFVHDFMLESLKVPYPVTVRLPNSVKFLGDLVRLSSLALMCRLSLPLLRHFPRGLAALLIGLLVIMLNETFRVFAIESTIIGNPFYAAFDIAPRALSWLTCGAAVAWLSISDGKSRNVAIAVIVLAALEVFALRPALDAACAFLKNHLSAPTTLYTDPYPFKINALIYVTFVEPTIAAFAFVSFCWPALGNGTLRRIMAFAALLLLIRGRVTQFFVETFWVNQPLGIAFLAESQFLLETLVLGSLVALTWSYAMRIQSEVGRSTEARP